MLPSSATAAGSVPAGAVGSDISWPQCGRANPADPYSFAIIGVTGGHPFSTNDCFASEFAWAQSTGTPEMYINLDYGLRTEGPLQCSVGDTGCQAYNYGYDSAQWAYLYAAVSTNGASNALGVWWLDVEIGNYWSEDTEQNSYVVQGALDYLQRSQGKTVGAYSTSWMWAKLVGGYEPPNTPNWVAGASGLDDTGKCAASLWPGGQVWVIQYLNYDLDLDQNLGC